MYKIYSVVNSEQNSEVNITYANALAKYFPHGFPKEKTKHRVAIMPLYTISNL